MNDLNFKGLEKEYLKPIIQKLTKFLSFTLLKITFFRKI